MATYHGLIRVSCVACEWATRNDATMETLNDQDGTCPQCGEQFFKWENKDGSIVVSLTQNFDGLHTYDNLTWNQARTVEELEEPDNFSCGSCGGSFLEDQGRTYRDSENHLSFFCNDCKNLPPFDYAKRVEEATKEQGIDALLVELDKAGIRATAEQTGGFTMCAMITLKDGFYIYASPTGASVYNEADYEFDIVQFNEPQSPKTIAGAVWLYLNNKK